MTTDAAEAITSGRTALGLELGSTRIKAVLVGPDREVLASGGSSWENQLVDGRWTYALEDVWDGVAAAFGAVAAQVRERHGVVLERLGALGVSAMMHGYVALDADDELLVPFRTWRNTSTGEAVERLSGPMDFNVPHRWTVAHLVQAAIDGEEHLSQLAAVTTLAGYVHRRLTGELVLGVGDASGVFPVASAGGVPGYDADRLATAQRLLDEALPDGVAVSLADVLPRVAVAGEGAGELTEAGARLLDPSGALQPGALVCPPEGDAGTGMVATGSVAPRTGNVSAGTSIFAMVVLEGPLARVHRELDLVTTPAGDPVAMVHCNNGASELDAWARLFQQFAAALGAPADDGAVFGALFRASLDGAPDGGGMLAYNYLSGEPITELEEGRPLFLRTPGRPFDLPTFMRTQIYAAFATLKIGMDVLAGEGVRLDGMFAHGGVFATPGVAQRHLAAAIGAPVSVGDLASEGGAWGAAVLATYAADRAAGRDGGLSLAEYVAERVVAGARIETVEPDPDDVAGFDAFLRRYVDGLAVERAAVEAVTS
ncbi:FGGY-family carbohydrate kinase [Pseudokineococcus marinus]|uniref:ATPase n=1 Tax=Pseudokineococcus marinus TaxID=351215 RepID=A0A849BQZ1_9ACTN|nr:FGGY-family carbohydrate kinase [Pseudokineococcus marinus]NNH21956.1 ATPase [Pseudokineococcus marinus]